MPFDLTSKILSMLPTYKEKVFFNPLSPGDVNIRPNVVTGKNAPILFFNCLENIFNIY